MNASDERSDRGHGTAALGLSLCLLFFISGTAGLIYEVAWKHLFTVTFGNTTYAVSVVISVFMAGLALGSYVLGKLADRTTHYLAVLALLEVAIAATALAVPPLVDAAELLYGAVFRASQSPLLLVAVQVPVSAAILLPPTFLMGGTLPVLSRFMAGRSGRVGASVGTLYGLNTLGAAVGAFLTGFVLVKALGTRQTIHVAALANAALAVGFAALARWVPAGAAVTPAPRRLGPQQEGLGRGRLALLLAAVAVSGFVSFSYEVLWTRLLTFRLQTTVYAFSIMLTAFLLGLGLGGALVGLLGRRSTSAYWRLYGWLEAGVGVCGLVGLLLFFVPTPDFESFAARTLSHLLLSMAVMIVPTTLVGAAFPIACDLLASGVERTGRSVGTIYVVNTVGAVTGALVTGFLLVRVLGTEGSLTLVSLLIVLSGSAVLATAPAAGAAAPRLRRWGPAAAVWAAALCSLVAVEPGLLPLVSGRPRRLQQYLLRNQSLAIAHPGEPVRLVGYGEGPEGVVVVSELKGSHRVIAAGGTDVAGTSYILRNTQKLQAHIPMLIHPDPQYVCQIGFGSGETARIFASYDVKRFDCVEISPVMLRMADRYFRDINGGVLGSGRCNIVLMDAAAYLRYTDRKYDIIANDATWPSQAGPAMLFTLEHFENGRRHLRPGGIMTSWLPLDMPQQDIRTVLKTFHQVFPYVYVWTALSHLNKHALLVGCMQPLEIDASRFLDRFNRYARKDLASVYLDDPAAFLACHFATANGMEEELSSVTLSTNDRPALQFMHSRLYRQADMLVDAYRLLARHRDSILGHLTGLDNADPQGELATSIERMYAAVDHLLAALTMDPSRDIEREREVAAARKAAPRHPASRLIAAAARERQALSQEELSALALPALKEKARELLRSAAYPQALLAFEEWDRREPDSAAPKLGIGTCYLLMRRYSEALGPLREATTLDPDSADAQFQLGVACLRLGRAADAVGPLGRTVALAPQSAVARANLGTALAMLGRTREAVAHLSRALALDPQLLGARLNLGALLLKQGDYRNAIANLEKLIELGGESAEAHRLLAEAYRNAGDAAAAQRHLRRAERLHAAKPGSGSPADAAAP